MTAVSTTPSWLLKRVNLFRGLIMVILLVLSFQLDFRYIRMIHIIAGFVWYAMLVFLVVVFLPIVDRFSEKTLYEIVGYVLPRIFHTVTVAGFFAVGVGWYKVYLLSGWRLSYFYPDPIDILFTISIVMVTLMYFFHLFLESSEINVSAAVAEGLVESSSEEYKLLIKGLRITPRVGFVIITFAIIAMFLHI